MQLTEEILRERKTGIGGSDCAAVLGLSPWATPLEIYLSKINPDSILQEPNDAMKDGQDLEPMVIKRYSEATNSKVEQPNKIFKNEQYPWMLANIDGIVVNKNVILEAKTTKFFSDGWGSEDSDYIPDQYLFQVAHYCIVLDKPCADIAAWSYGSPLRIYHYCRNKELEQQIIDLTHDFWYNHVEKRLPPDPESQSDIIKLYQKADESKTLIADNDLSDLIYDYYQLSDSLKNLENNKKKLQNKIKILMKDNAYINDLTGERLISWKNQHTTRFNISAFKDKHPVLYKQFCVSSENRILRDHIKKEKS